MKTFKMTIAEIQDKFPTENASWWRKVEDPLMWIRTSYSTEDEDYERVEAIVPNGKDVVYALCEPSQSARFHAYRLLGETYTGGIQTEEESHGDIAVSYGTDEDIAAQILKKIDCPIADEPPKTETIHEIECKLSEMGLCQLPEWFLKGRDLKNVPYHTPKPIDYDSVQFNAQIPFWLQCVLSAQNLYCTRYMLSELVVPGVSVFSNPDTDFYMDNYIPGIMEKMIADYSCDKAFFYECTSKYENFLKAYYGIVYKGYQMCEAFCETAPEGTRAFLTADDNEELPYRWGLFIPLQGLKQTDFEKVALAANKAKCPIDLRKK